MAGQMKVLQERETVNVILQITVLQFIAAQDRKEIIEKKLFKLI